MEKQSKDPQGIFSHLKQELKDEINPIDLHKPASDSESIKPTPADFVRAYISEAVDSIIP